MVRHWPGGVSEVPGRGPAIKATSAAVASMGAGTDRLGGGAQGLLRPWLIRRAGRGGGRRPLCGGHGQQQDGLPVGTGSMNRQ